MPILAEAVMVALVLLFAFIVGVLITRLVYSAMQRRYDEGYRAGCDQQQAIYNAVRTTLDAQLKKEVYR